MIRALPRLIILIAYYIVYFCYLSDNGRVLNTHVLQSRIQIISTNIDIKDYSSLSYTYPTSYASKQLVPHSIKLQVMFYIHLYCS